ncbi:hypothetical protein IE53DRAFT_381986 [Violaceomyces palustris]|uniref:Uncharacterized protein n=1 Tax=Violaceomyces palustris TaxID=1673888 RepID=A0ACD0NPF7_9BASI|nr:hypothetical protein IE53DRAFT_381986 [Violaceomyces palustris]
MSYTIAGKKFLNEHVALAVLGTYGALGYLSSGGDKKASASAPAGSKDASSVPTPPINASSSDEEAFIKQFLAEAESKDGQRQV